MAGKTPTNFKIACENFDQIVAANLAKGGLIDGISSQRPDAQSVGEATIGAMTLIGETTPPYVVAPPLAVDGSDLPNSYKTIYRTDLPGGMAGDLKNCFSRFRENE